MPDKATVTITPLIVSVVCTLWSGLVSFIVAKWTLARQSRSNEIADLVNLIERLSASASAFWLSSGRKKEAEAKLKHKLLRLNAELDRLFSKHSCYEKIMNDNILFRREITGGQFENENRTEENGRSATIVELGEDLIKKIKSLK